MFALATTMSINDKPPLRLACVCFSLLRYDKSTALPVACTDKVPALPRMSRMPQEPLFQTALFDAAIAPSGQASADYREHGQRPRGMRVSQWLSVHGSDKVSTHNYGSFYDSLFDRLRPQALLEIGVYRGASLRAWRAAGVPVVVGVDRDVTQNRSGLPVLYAEMPHEIFQD